MNASYEKAGGAAVTLEEIKRFRQLDSRTPGHPEYHWVSGVEATTGPLGQGIAMSVGMAIAGKFLASRYNQPAFDLFDYDVYAICGDGCMMEGVGSEAASLAGHLGLDNLCWIYDNNHITIEGSTSIAFTEDVIARFIAYGWNVMRVSDANDTGRIEQALWAFAKSQGRPTLIVIDSHIGYGSPHRHDSAEAHGEPLGEEEVKAAKREYGWPEDAQFLVPPEAYDDFARGIGARGAAGQSAWLEKFTKYRLRYPALAAEIEQMQRRELPEWDRELPVFAADLKGVSGRDASGAALNAIARNIPWFLGGSADLGPSNRTTLKFAGAGDYQAPSPSGRNLHFGVREHAMGAISNGLALSKLRPFAATFFIFSDYARPAIRLAALMELPVIFVFTHEALSDGEDGPTHQPVEQLISLRAVPGLTVIRPGDANEVVEAYRCVIKMRHRPCVLALPRQPLPTLDRSRYGAASGVANGAYVLADSDGPLQLILIATGSEVSTAIQAYETLRSEGVRCRVVSMPSWDLFEQQSATYRESVLPTSVTARLAIEQGSTLGWERFVGPKGRVIGMQTFGGSAPLKMLLGKFGFDPGSILKVAREMLSSS